MPTPYDVMNANMRTAILAFAQRIRDVSQSAQNSDLAQNSLKLEGLSLAQIYDVVRGIGYTGTIKELSDELDAFMARTDNPHSVTKAQVGLGNVQNFGVATKLQAEDKLITNVYMTPERTWDAVMAFWAQQVGAAPSTLDTIAELSAALQNDPSIITALQTSVANKVNTSDYNTAINNLNIALANLASNIASDAEMRAGTDNSKFVTPRGVKTIRGDMETDISTHIAALTTALNDGIALIDAP